MTTHPSFLELDRVVLGELDDRQIREHLQGCETCRAHVDSAQRAGVTPAWARQLEKRPKPSRSSWLWAGGLASLAGAAAIFVFIPKSSPPTAPEYTAVKGAASLAVHIKRGEGVELWDGQFKLMPADALRLEVVPAEHSHVAVFAIENGEPVELYNAPLPQVDAPTVLPKAWEVDAEAGPETIVVVLSRSPIDAIDLDEAPDQLALRGIWLERLVFHKDLSGLAPPD